MIGFFDDCGFEGTSFLFRNLETKWISVLFFYLFAMGLVKGLKFLMCFTVKGMSFSMRLD